MKNNASYIPSNCLKPQYMIAGINHGWTLNKNLHQYETYEFYEKKKEEIF